MKTSKLYFFLFLTFCNHNLNADFNLLNFEKKFKDISFKEKFKNSIKIKTKELEEELKKLNQKKEFDELLTSLSLIGITFYKNYFFITQMELLYFLTNNDNLKEKLNIVQAVAIELFRKQMLNTQKLKNKKPKSEYKDVIIERREIVYVPSENGELVLKEIRNYLKSNPEENIENIGRFKKFLKAIKSFFIKN